MRQGARVLSIKGIARLEVEEDKLGIPVTTKYHVKVPPRYSAVFEVNLHGNCEGTKIISPNKQLMEMNPNTFQHEISIKPDGNKYFPVVAITNLDHAKMLHLAKGEIVGFAHKEEVEMNYIETTNILEIEKMEQRAPRNWIPERSWKNYNKYIEIPPQHTEVSEVTVSQSKMGDISPNPVEIFKQVDIRTTQREISHKKSDKTDHSDESNSEKDFEKDFFEQV